MLSTCDHRFLPRQARFDVYLGVFVAFVDRRLRQMLRRVLGVVQRLSAHVAIPCRRYAADSEVPNSGTWSSVTSGYSYG